MALLRKGRVELIALTAALLALSACGSSSDGGGSSTCAGCEGALCGGTCTDLRDTLKARITAALPSSACIPRQDLPNTIFTTACATSSCGGAPGCNVQLTWTPVSLSLATHKLTLSVHATSNMDVAQNNAPLCTAAVTADYAFEADVGFVCAAGSESLAVGTITPTLTTSSNTGCEVLGAFVDPLPTFARDPAAAALARATTGLSASCP